MSSSPDRPNEPAPPAWNAPSGDDPVAGSGATSTDTKAVVALVLAVAAYTPTVPFIGAIAALVVSRMAKRDIRASGGTRSGLGLCRTADVLAVVHLVLVALAVLVVVALVLLPFSFT